MAYMYVSAPIKAITGIVYLGKRHLLSDWREKFKNDRDAVARIENIKNHIDMLWRLMNSKKQQRYHLRI